MFISVSRDPVIRSLLPSVVSITRGTGDFDYCLFWLPALHFYLNENLSAEQKLMFVNIFSASSETPFKELSIMCVRLSEAQ